MKFVDLRYLCFPLQFQSFVQFRGKLKSRSSEEIQKLKDTPNVWNIHSMINVLYSLVDKSNINKQVECYIGLRVVYKILITRVRVEYGELFHE